MTSKSKKKSSGAERQEAEWVPVEGQAEYADDVPTIDVNDVGEADAEWLPVSDEEAEAAPPDSVERKPRRAAASVDPGPAVAPKAKRTPRAARAKPGAKSGPPRPAQIDADAGAQEPTGAADPSQQAKQSMEPVAKRRRARKGVDQQPPAVAAPLSPVPNPPITSDATDAPSDGPTEPASPLPSMEQYIAELGRMSVPELTKRHVEVLGKAPRIKNRTWLQRKLAWFEQTRRFGGLSNAAKKRLDELMGEIQLPVPTPRGARTASGKLPTPRSADDLPIGTRLERKWRDRLITATRVEGGWECEGGTYRTLSAAAKAVSGSHVSGPAFFGLRPRKDAR